MPVVWTVLALVAATLVRRQAPWVPWPYLLALIGLVVAIWVLARPPADSSLDRLPRRARLGGTAAAIVVLIALLPVPWMTATLDAPPGTAWRLDGRLHVDGDRIDPPGEWYWLTVGRPPVVAEVVRGWFSSTPTAVSLRSGTGSATPRLNEPAAAAVGLRAAGRVVELRLVVELSAPTERSWPERLVVERVGAHPITSVADWDAALTELGTTGTLVIADATGTRWRVTGPELPYGRIELLEVPDGDLEAFIGGRLAATPVGRWFRGLALGRSHGLMVALITYAHASGEDLARGRSIAGTGGVRGDGTVTRVGGLPSKAIAAARAGVDVLLVPDEQAHLLDGADLGSLTVVPVSSLDEAISALRDPTWETE